MIYGTYRQRDSVRVCDASVQQKMQSEKIQALIHTLSLQANHKQKATIIC